MVICKALQKTVYLLNRAARNANMNITDNIAKAMGNNIEGSKVSQ